MYGEVAGVAVCSHLPTAHRQPVDQSAEAKRQTRVPSERASHESQAPDQSAE